MDKFLNYIKENHLKLIIILILLFMVNQQFKILDNTGYCQCSNQLDDIGRSITEIKNKLGI